MEESVTYQWIVEKGQLKEAKALLLRMGRKRFGLPDGSATATIEAIEDLEQLEKLSDRLPDVATWQEFLSELK